MRLKPTLILPLLLTAGVLPETSQGQLVDLGPGYIQTPFVRLQRRGGYRASLRVPFVNIGGQPQGYPQQGYPQQGYGQQPYGQPTYSQQPVPTEAVNVGPTVATAPVADDIADQDWQSLRNTIVAAEAELDQQLQGMAAADRWRSMLHVGTLREVLTDDSNMPPTDPMRDRLQPVLEAYNSALITPELRPITRMSGFQTVQAALRELLLSPAERQRGRLLNAAGQLNVALGSIRYGSGWADYLRLPDSLYRLGGPAIQRSTTTAVAAEPPLEELKASLTRFESTDKQERYRSITTLPAFQATYRQLGDYVALLQGSSVEDPTVEVSTIEEPTLAQPAPNEPTLSQPTRGDSAITIQQRTKPAQP